MERGELQNGSSGWMEGRWQDTRPTMPQEISPSLWTFMPRENTITMTMTNCQVHSPSGSSQRWWEVAPPLPLSAVPSTNSPPTIGVLWLRLIGIGQWTSNAKASRPKSTSSNKRWKRREWNEASVKGDLRQPRPTSTSAVSIWVKQGRDTNKTKCEEICFTKCDGDTVVDMGVHSDQDRGVTGLGNWMPL